MKSILKVLGLAVVASASTGVFADDSVASPLGIEFSGSAALTTDYRFRGITQTQSDPAIQGTFTFSHESGLYFSAFASNVDFGEGSPHLELDPSIGYSGELDFGGNFKPVLDAGVVRYNYPSYSDLAWNEYYVKLIFSDVIFAGSSLLTNVNYTNDYAANFGDSWNFTVGYTVPFKDSGFGLVTSVGYTDIEDKGALADPDATDYFDYKAGLTYGFKSISGLGAELAVVGTDIDTKGLTKSVKRGIEPGAVFTLTKAF